MGLWPIRTNEKQFRHPRAGGGPRREELDSRLRGNDVVGAIWQSEILPLALDDKGTARNDTLNQVFTRAVWPRPSVPGEKSCLPAVASLPDERSCHGGKFFCFHLRFGTRQPLLEGIQVGVVDGGDVKRDEL